MSSGEWLFWCWVCGIGNHFVALNIDRVDFPDEANLMGTIPWWLKDRLLWIYIRYLEAVGDLGVLMASVTRNPLGYWLKLTIGF